MTGNLNRDDVARLLSDPSAASRAAVAAKIASTVDSETLSGGEYRLAQDIVHLMAQDAAAVVREALAVNLKTSRHLPREVALALVQDIDQVALPILEYSEVLEEADLVEMVRNAPESKQTAIARRPSLSEKVTDALIETDNRNVVRTVVSNPGAQLTEATLNRVVDRFGDAEDIQQPLVHRAKLPMTVAERLVAKVSDQLKDYLVTHHELSADTAAELILRVRERATIGLAGGIADEAEIEKLVIQLARNGRLTPSLILRALCVGDLTFFELAISHLAGVPVLNARLLIHDRGSLGLRSLYQKARLPDALFPAFRLAVSVVVDTDLRGADYDRETFAETLLERILTQCEDLRPDDAEYLLRKLNDLAGDNADAA